MMNSTVNMLIMANDLNSKSLTEISFDISIFQHVKKCSNCNWIQNATIYCFEFYAIKYETKILFIFRKVKRLLLFDYFQKKPHEKNLN